MHLMDLNKGNAREILRRYRKPLIAAVVGLAAMMMLVVGVAGYAVYKTATFATDRITAWKPGEPGEPAEPVKPREPGQSGKTAVELAAPASGVVGTFVLNVASGWLQQEVAQGEIARVKDGLACFTALGGPSPSKIVGYVQKTVNDATLAARLEDLNESLRKSGALNNGPAACASWILNG